ncbi:MAG TPA: hydrogenase [Candidatus Aenigmarchaeota archaeon]|nr:MAG: hydrogenase [Candidatus Aenigmarchaeota archaeon]HDD46404.1 hydrogenase [Candidatus Aenigmarchaeota archaeon]
MMMTTLSTIRGFWDPVLWMAAFIIVIVITCYIRSLGKEEYKRGTEQTMVFFSGNIPPKELISSSNIYWGFFKAMEKYYTCIRRFHTGMVNDYVYYFIVIVIVIIASLIIGGVLWM